MRRSRADAEQPPAIGLAVGKQVERRARLAGRSDRARRLARQRRRHRRPRRPQTVNDRRHRLGAIVAEQAGEADIARSARSRPPTLVAARRRLAAAALACVAPRTVAFAAVTRCDDVIAPLPATSIAGRTLGELSAVW